MSKEMKFTVFCIENYKLHRALSGKAVFRLFAEYDVFSYLRECYDTLHTVGAEYLNRDIDEFLKVRGASL